MTHSIYGELALISGSANEELAREISAYLKTPLVGRDIHDYPNENIFVRLHHSIRSTDMFIIQPTTSPVNRNIMELLETVARFKEAGDTGLFQHLRGRSNGLSHPGQPHA